MSDQLFASISQYPLAFAACAVSLLEIPPTLLSHYAPSSFPIEYADVYSTILALLLTVLYYISSAQTARQSFLCLAVSIWAIRLSTFLGSRVKAGFRDSRLDIFRGSIKRAARWGFAQALWVFLTLVPVWIGMSSSARMSSLSAVDIAAMGLCAIGLVIEVLADVQKTAFLKFNKAQPEAARKLACDVGLFKYSRFPNYFGEWLFWTSLCLLTWQGSEGLVKMLLPVSSWFVSKVFFLFSIPIAVTAIKRRATEGQFAEWCEISIFVPLPRRKKS
ncbi:unnamed protein product [Chondrus crispus]|uniref:Uncharacterized protein n=1 Tax=Chondrus crispus TaxID=2769 RepID=R7QCL9_CHOCR|nr:unnamed protein product [Chondrus crispus]CDF35176.1 unnamed protein product [Chondrus crispus]|eukprot:XP_005714995.1 unnamed protein product [Chondrus crispus]